MLSALAIIPAISATTLITGFDPAVPGDPQVLTDQPVQTNSLSQRHHRDQARARDEVGVVESC